MGGGVVALVHTHACVHVPPKALSPLKAEAKTLSSVRTDLDSRAVITGLQVPRMYQVSIHEYHHPSLPRQDVPVYDMYVYTTLK